MTRATMANAATRSPLAAARCAGRRLATAALLPPLAPSRPVQPAAGLRLPAAPRRGRPLVQRAAARSDGLDEILAKYGSSGGGGGDSRAPLVKVAPPRGASGGMGNGLFAVLILNFGLFAASNLLHVPALSASVLALNHWKPQWWQFVTATFMHANWQHLSSNAFALLVFGRMVEEEEGAFGLWATYLLAGVGGTLASYLSAPHTHTVSLGASGAVFGLFMVALIAKFKPSLKRLLEMTILGQFVVQQVLGEFAMVAGGRGATLGGMQVGHVAHLAGAAAGVLLVLLVSRLPDPGEEGSA